MKKFLIILLSFALAGCAKDAEVSASSSNPHVTVDTLFQHHDCTMYRFKDRGRFHYYAVCDTKNSTTISSQTDGSGKKRRRYDSNIDTHRRE